MGEKKMSKAQMMQAAAALYGQAVLHKIEGIEPLDLYAKTFTVKEFRDLMARQASFDDRHDDGYNPERCMALELFDADGNQVFDPENMEDVLFLAGLPYAVRSEMGLASSRANNGDYLKNLSATGSGL